MEQGRWNTSNETFNDFFNKRVGGVCGELSPVVR
jgi:hypothetical protein